MHQIGEGCERTVFLEKTLAYVVTHQTILLETELWNRVFVAVFCNGENTEPS